MRHTESILKNIKEEMLFSGKVISIERAAILESLKGNQSRVTIICGKGGIGKTVEIKKLYKSMHHSRPIFAFKANEFELNRLDDLMSQGYVNDFLAFFDENKDKTIVIDSAEKLLDLESQEVIKEFIDKTVEYGWHVIFTTRDHYFDDLNFLCFDILNVNPEKIYIPELTEEELYNLSSQHNFQIPTDLRLKQLLKIPFYLNEYLRFYDDSASGPYDYSKYKDHLWSKKIKNGDIKREQVFSQLARQRANEGKFYLSIETHQIEPAKALMQDEILGTDGGFFFISHDIYEEWALEKFIDIEFKNKSSNDQFFKSIGKSLAVRRSFRQWLSEQLCSGERRIQNFIERAIDDDSIESIWKDELIVAILLSDYSSTFFEYFENDLIKNDLKLLKRLCFMLRTACKELDNSIFSLLGLKQNDNLSYSLFLTKPKGSGWASLIDFVHSHIQQIEVENISIFVPLLYEWNSSFKKGDTSRKASLLCIEHYKWLEQGRTYLGDGKFSDSLVKTIVYGASEVQEELTNLFKEIYKSRVNNEKVPFERLAKLILNDLDGLHAAKVLPEKTLQLGESLWLFKHQDGRHYNSHREMEHVFGITDDFDFRYTPESALQTPIFYMLGFKLKETVDFVLNFTNQITQNLVNHYGEERIVKRKITVGNETNEIYIDKHLWVAYRGAGGAPNLIKSILMALEKFLIENANKFKDNTLELWLKYLLSRTNSSSICGVVSSIVMANQDSLFNVAKILFSVKEFIQFDNERLIFDRQHKSQLTMIGNMFGGINHGKMYHEERLKACDDVHRSNSLEKMFFYYQVFAPKGVTEESEVQNRQKELWVLLDKYYDELEGCKDSEETKLWRFCIARMDRRKMDIETEVQGDKTAIFFNPELEPDLKELSEKTQSKQEQDFKYLSLKLWANNKFEQHEDPKKYEQYELNIGQAILDLKELIEKLSDKENPPTEDFVLLNQSTPLYASTALIKFHNDVIEKDDLNLCIEIVLGFIHNVFSEQYRYQVGDGMKLCFDIIPDIFALRSELQSDLKMVLLAGLFRTDSINIWGSQGFYVFPSNAIHKLWEGFVKDAESLLIGYLLLKPKYSELINVIRKENFAKKQYDTNFDGLWQRFSEENQKIIEKMHANEFSGDYIVDFSKLEINTKAVGLFLIPNNANELCQKTFLELVKSSASYLLSKERDGSGNFQSKREFLKKYAYYVLQSPKNILSELLQPFLDTFNPSEGSSDILEEFVYAQDSLSVYENFWCVWELFKPKVVRLAEADYLSYRHNMINDNYFFPSTTIKIPVPHSL